MNEQQTRDRGKSITHMSRAGVTRVAEFKLKTETHGVKIKKGKNTHMMCHATRVQQGQPESRE